MHCDKGLCANDGSGNDEGKPDLETAACAKLTTKLDGTAKGLNKVFDDAGNCTDERIEKRLRGAATALVDYVTRTVCPARALENMVRET